jgi:hypothetical protein
MAVTTLTDGDDVDRVVTLEDFAWSAVGGE